MADFLLSAGAFVVLMVALGLVRVARGPGRAERMMAAQLLGSGAVGALLLFGAASGDSAVFDVALTLALLSAFASIAFVKFALRQDQTGRRRGGVRRERGCSTSSASSPSSPAPSSTWPARSGCCASRMPTRGCMR